MVFSLPGASRLLVDSILTTDYPVVQGMVLLVGIFVVMINLTVDLSYGWFDPRVRHG